MSDTEAEAIAALAEKAQRGPIRMEVDPGDQFQLVVPIGFDVKQYDLEGTLPAPRRAKGLLIVRDAGSLITYARRHDEELIETDGETTRANAAEKTTTALFADIDSTSVTAVLNGHGPQQTPGWGDHRAKLELRLTPAWKLWVGDAHNRKWMTQRDFAQHIEEGLAEIFAPPAAEMLEVAQSLQAANKVDFQSSTLLANGQRQFTYSETIQSKAGQKGNLTIPTTFRISVVPFEGQTQPYVIEARFQYRIDDGSLALRYLLTRPEDVLRQAFLDVVTEVEKGTGLRSFYGLPPQ